MIEIKQKDILFLEEVEFICNAANAQGLMDGGLAEAIRNKGGRQIEKESIQLCKEERYQVGQCFSTHGGALPFQKIIHCITMKYPGRNSTYEIVEMCLKNLVSYCQKEKINKIGIPALGTGVGGLDKEKVAKLFQNILGPIKNITFVVCDIDKEIIKIFEQNKKEQV